MLDSNTRTSSSVQRGNERMNKINNNENGVTDSNQNRFNFPRITSMSSTINTANTNNHELPISQVSTSNLNSNSDDKENFSYSTYKKVKLKTEISNFLKSLKWCLFLFYVTIPRKIQTM